jgi:hypothetical protein
VTEELLARNHGTNFLNALPLITVPGVPAGGAAADGEFTPAAVDGLLAEGEAASGWGLWLPTPATSRPQMVSSNLTFARSLRGTAPQGVPVLKRPYSAAVDSPAKDQVFAQLGEAAGGSQVNSLDSGWQDLENLLPALIATVHEAGPWNVGQ